MKRIALYGKGGGGKSTVCSNLAFQLARMDQKVIQIGCDPKGDSTLSLTGGRKIPTVVSLMASRRISEIEVAEFLSTGESGVDCVEAGGPEPGVGCAGRGIVNVFQLVKRHDLLSRYDVALLDVLGDVVCGGFAVPLMKGISSTVAVVVADNLMSMYAANNIARGVLRFERNGARLAGLIANNLRRPEGRDEVAAFADRIGTRLLAVIPNDADIVQAERARRLVSQTAPASEAARLFSELASNLISSEDQKASPKPMGEADFDEFVRTVIR